MRTPCRPVDPIPFDSSVRAPAAWIRFAYWATIHPGRTRDPVDQHGGGAAVPGPARRSHALQRDMNRVNTGPMNPPTALTPHPSFLSPSVRSPLCCCCCRPLGAPPSARRAFHYPDRSIRLPALEPHVDLPVPTEARLADQPPDPAARPSIAPAMSSSGRSAPPVPPLVSASVTRM